jgi:putative hydrolase of the HAD superfamily
MFDLIAFDGDDTLWHNERLYTAGRERFRELLTRYGAEAGDERLDEIEIGNLPYYGYGVMSFALSLIETAIDLTGGQITGEDLRPLLDMAKEMLTAEVDLFAHVEETLIQLSSTHTLMLITKGDLLHQLKKVRQSGLDAYFRYVEVVSDKTLETYTAILERYDCAPGRFLMIGNSLRSDVFPVLKAGGHAVYIPNDLTWSHEIVEPPTGDSHQYFQVEHIGLLPDLIAQLTTSSPMIQRAYHRTEAQKERDR